MPDFFDLMWRWHKQILSLALTTLIVTTGVVFLFPKRDLSTATALPTKREIKQKLHVFLEFSNQFGLRNWNAHDLIIANGIYKVNITDDLY